MIRYYFLAILLLTLPSCYRVTIDKELVELNYATKLRTCSQIVLQHADCFDPVIQERITTMLDKGMSRNDAVTLALMNNKKLQAKLEQLGIAKADLVQAGLFTNPEINSVFRIPVHVRTRHINTETEALFPLSDLWQVPLRKHVAQDELEIASLDILNFIIDISAHTSRLYNTVLFYESLYKVLMFTCENTQQLRDLFYARQRFGFNTDLENFLSDIEVDALTIKIELTKARKNATMAELKNALGLSAVCTRDLVLIDTFETISLDIPPIETLIKWAYENKPEIHIAALNIQRYTHAVKLEKARILKNVRVGAGVKTEPDGLKLVGPAVDLQIPLFDQNQAQIAKAQFALNQAKKELIAQKLETEAEVYRAVELIKALQVTIATYSNQIKPLIKKSLDYSDIYVQNMQLSPVVVLQTKLRLYQLFTQILETRLDAVNMVVDLERAVGKRITIKNEKNDTIESILNCKK